MEQLDTLHKLHNNEITVLDAYDTLYKVQEVKTPPLKKAHFIRLNIHLLNESNALNQFLRILFMFPIPIAIVRFALRFMNVKKINHTLDIDTIKQLIASAKHTKINIASDDAIIKISID